LAITLQKSLGGFSFIAFNAIILTGLLISGNFDFYGILQFIAIVGVNIISIFVINIMRDSYYDSIDFFFMSGAAAIISWLSIIFVLIFVSIFFIEDKPIVSKPLTGYQIKKIKKLKKSQDNNVLIGVVLVDRGNRTLSANVKTQADLTTLIKNPAACKVRTVEQRLFGKHVATEYEIKCEKETK